MLTIDVKTFFICLLIIAIIVLVVFAIVAVYRLIKSLKKLDKVLEDFEVVSTVASARTKQLDNAINNVSKTFSGASKKIKDSSGIINVITILVSMFVNIRNVVMKDREKNQSAPKKE
ncbi:MAG: hypothetical protein LBS85_01090 [Clostridiales Family XIII bacterium]|jgi:hypothetical protein|nr:hypothetical protein [Clostridiales Family XIII bacterium]